jgi:hypothetical protein
MHLLHSENRKALTLQKEKDHSILPPPIFGIRCRKLCCLGPKNTVNMFLIGEIFIIVVSGRRGNSNKCFSQQEAISVPLWKWVSLPPSPSPQQLTAGGRHDSCHVFCLASSYSTADQWGPPWQLPRVLFSRLRTNCWKGGPPWQLPCVLFSHLLLNSWPAGAAMPVATCFGPG